MASAEADSPDAGFVLVDALLGVALVAAAGVTVYALGSDTLRNQERALDRTVAVATMTMLAKEVAVTGVPPQDMEDDAFVYRVRLSRGGLSGPLSSVFVDAMSGDETISVSVVVGSR